MENNNHRIIENKMAQYVSQKTLQNAETLQK